MKIPGWLVFAASVAGFAALCWDAGSHLPEAYPSVARCLRDPARYAGREIWIIPAKVSASGPEEYEVMHGGGGTVRVRATTQPPLGSYVYVNGIFRADGVVDQRSILIDNHFIAERDAIVAISLVMLAIFAGLFHRAFAWRNGAFHVRDPRSAVAPPGPQGRSQGEDEHSAEAPHEPMDRN
jgi:hypothetical protein